MVEFGTPDRVISVPLFEGELHKEFKNPLSWKELSLETANLALGLAIALPVAGYWRAEDLVRRAFKYLRPH